MHLPNQELQTVPMFPLPNVVLLPGTLMPLHIFEPRYREMTRDVLQGSNLMAVARLQPGHDDDYFGRPPVYTTLGIGRILASNQLSDGRYNILVRGLIRARVAEEFPPDRAYRRIRAEAIHDHDDLLGDDERVPAAAQQKLIALCDQLSETMDQGGEQLRELVRSAGSPGECADLISSALVTEVEDRQVLLETPSPLTRIEHTIHHVSQLLADLGARDGMTN